MPGEDPGDDLGRPLAPQRLPVVGVRGPGVDEDERAAGRGREATQELLGVRVALLVDEEQRRVVLDRPAGGGRATRSSSCPLPVAPTTKTWRPERRGTRGPASSVVSGT